MRTPALFALALLILLPSLAGCEFLNLAAPYLVQDRTGDDDSVVPVEMTPSSTELARESILLGRPQASSLLIDKLNLVLPTHNLTAQLTDSVGLRLSEGPESGTEVPNECPYRTRSLPDRPDEGPSLSCKAISDTATTASLLTSSTIKSGVLQRVTAGRTLTAGEHAYVAAWTDESILSGIDTGAIGAIEVLRSLSLCGDQEQEGGEAFALGVGQGKALFNATADEMIPNAPKTQCNTDVIAASILAEARSRADAFNDEHVICADFDRSEIEEGVDLEAMDDRRRDGVIEGIEEEYELIRVWLVENWECEPTREVDAGPERPDDPCRCFARYSGSGPVYCFYESDFETYPPWSGGDLRRMDDRGVPQCEGDSSGAIPVGSPLVIDLDGDGIRLSPTETMSFDLAATGEPVRIAALTGKDAFLVLDRNGDSVIDSGAELFGNNASCGDQRCSDGLEALAYFDANEDAVIDSHDAVFEQLRLWRDRDGDGIGQVRELTSLQNHGVVAIEVAARLDVAWVDAQGNSAMRAASVHRVGAPDALVHDVWFALRFDELPLQARTSGLTSRLNQRSGR